MASARGPGSGRPPAGRSRRSDARATERPRARTTAPQAPGRRRTEPKPRRGSELGARILIAVPASVLAIALVDLGGLPWALFMIVLGWLCLHELYRMLGRWRPAPAVGFAALAGMVLAARYGTQRDVMEVAVATLPVLFLVVLGRGQSAGVTVSVAGTLLGVFWVGLAFAHAELLRQLPHGGSVMIDVMVGTFLGDTGAYLGGRLFGRRPLAPLISPHKTVEGLFCGMLTAVLSVFLAGLFQETWLTRGDALLLGLAVAVLGPLGDLFESVVKRDAGTKDAGNVFGAHGGALDRLDAVIFTTVAGYYIWLALSH
jgi:phosphatidate cytidylyltransferase